MPAVHFWSPPPENIPLKCPLLRRNRAQQTDLHVVPLQYANLKTDERLPGPTRTRVPPPSG